MINWFALLAGILYIGAGVYSFTTGNRPMSGMWFAYAVANFFLTWAEYRAGGGA